MTYKQFLLAVSQGKATEEIQNFAAKELDKIFEREQRNQNQDWYKKKKEKDEELEQKILSLMNPRLIYAVGMIMQYLKEENLSKEKVSALMQSLLAKNLVEQKSAMFNGRRVKGYKLK